MTRSIVSQTPPPAAKGVTILSTLSAIEDALNRDEKGDALAILQNARDVLTTGHDHIWVGTGDDRVVCDECGFVRTTCAPAVEPVTQELETALKAFIWTTIEAKNLLHCISIAADHGESVDEDIRPAVGIAIDGVARLLKCVSREFEHLDGAIRITEQAEVAHV